MFMRFPIWTHGVERGRDFGQITCPSLLFWGTESFAPVPEDDPRRLAIPNNRLITVPNAGTGCIMISWIYFEGDPGVFA